jgi:hypothetical protein
LHEITPDHHEVLSNACHSPQLVHQSPHQHGIGISPARQSSKLIEVRD